MLPHIFLQIRLYFSHFTLYLAAERDMILYAYDIGLPIVSSAITLMAAASKLIYKVNFLMRAPYSTGLEMMSAAAFYAITLDFDRARRGAYCYL